MRGRSIYIDNRQSKKYSAKKSVDSLLLRNNDIVAKFAYALFDRLRGLENKKNISPSDSGLLDDCYEGSNVKSDLTDSPHLT